MNKELLKKYNNYLEIRHINKAYLSYVRIYLEYIAKNSLDAYSMSKEDLESFFLTKKDLTPSGINNYVKAIKDFYKCLSIVNPITDWKVLKAEKKLPTYITIEELDALVRYGITYFGFINSIKLKAILYFLFYTGVRKKEFLNLKREDINLKENQALIRIPTKSKEERVVIFPKKVSKMLESYFKIGEETNAFNITEPKLIYLIGRLNEFTTKKITIHTFRHSFAMHLVENDVRESIAQKLLGHSDIKTTMIYYRPNLKVIKQEYREKIK